MDYEGIKRHGKDNMILETERLYLREMKQSDYQSLCRILQDDETMYAYEGAFSDAEVQEWLDRQFERYRKYNFGLWAVILKETDEMIGQCGLTMQEWKEKEVLEVGYLFERRYWHRGYATEAAIACKKYAFEILKADEVCTIIRDINTASQRVALRNGMTKKDTWTKHYKGVDMPHYRYVAYRRDIKPLIAYCGLNCEKCDAYLATLNNDQTLREKTAKLWAELNQAPILPEHINCEGCRVEGVKTVYCEKLCSIRQCAIKKGVATCGDCQELDHCQTLRTFIDNNPDALKNLQK